MILGMRLKNMRETQIEQQDLLVPCKREETETKSRAQGVKAAAATHTATAAAAMFRGRR